MLSLNTMTSVIRVQTVLSLFNTVLSSAITFAQAALFPTTGRPRSLGVGYNLGGATVGSTASLICADMVGECRA